MHDYSRQNLMGTFDLNIGRLTDQLARIVRDGETYSLIDFTLHDGTVIEGVPVINLTTVCLYMGMPVFGERDIASLAPTPR